ncbi:MAG: hypothetical protein SGPRY_003308 [Prymnesium sp.]
MEGRIPLRLWGASHASRAYGSCVLLEHSPPSGDRLVLLVDSRGIAALLSEAHPTPPREGGLVGEGEEPWPDVQLIRLGSGEAEWVHWPHGEPHPRKVLAGQLVSMERHALTEGGRRAIVRAIHDYYLQHVLEPSVAGFLSVLEKQFARSDLYLFELLQNAVDEGSLDVRLELTSQGLSFWHDGQRFSPLDVNGLASVGMSTKAAKRAVGFMGIGFKACHKRFRQVVCSDRGEQRRGYVVLLVGCHFELLQPRGGREALLRDMRWLPPTVPPLLGLHALKAAARTSASASEHRWRLRWNSEQIVCAMSEAYGTVNSTTVGMLKAREEAVSVTRGIDVRSITSWQFITIAYSPDSRARTAYASHTRREMQAAQQEEPMEEARSIESLLYHAGPLTPHPHSHHPLGPWLLSVDRQDVQSLSDNAWNAAIASQLPALLVCALRLIARRSEQAS